MLGVTDQDSPERVRSAYREMLKTWHPDRFADDPARSADAVRHTRNIVWSG
jgi:DnaJ-class molecular chaperone